MAEIAELLDAAVLPAADDVDLEAKAKEYSKLAGDAVRFLVFRIMRQPLEKWSEAERKFIIGLIPILQARKRAIETVMTQMLIELESSEAKP